MLTILTGIQDKDATNADQRGDAALIRAARADPHAFAALYDRYVDMVYRYLYRQTGRRELAEDLTSLTFVRALAGLRRFDAAQPFAPWLMRIAHNALIDERRGAARVVNMDDDALYALRESSSSDVADDVEQAESFIAFTRDLTEKQRDALALRYIADLSVEQTAGALGRSVGATKMLITRALATLRASVAGNTQEDTK